MFALTSNQKAIWFDQQLFLHAARYNLCAAMCIGAYFWFLNIHHIIAYAWCVPVDLIYPYVDYIRMQIH